MKRWIAYQQMTVSIENCEVFQANTKKNNFSLKNL